MAKPKATDKLDLKMSMSKASNDVNMAVYSLQRIMHGISVEDIISAAEIIKAECGERALIEVSYDPHWGSDGDLTWWRKETDEEVEKRIASNEKKRKTAAETRKKAKKEKIETEKAELKRLTAKYPDLIEED